MDLVTLTLFSMAMASFGLFQSIPFTAIQPRYSFPERFQSAFRIAYVMGHAGEALNMVFPPRYLNGSLIDPGELTMALPSAPLAVSVSTDSGNLYPAMDNLSEQTAVAVFTDYTMDSEYFDAASGKFNSQFGSRFLRQITSYLYPLIQYLKNPYWVLSLFAPVALIKMAVVATNSISRGRKCIQAVEMVDAEIMVFVKEIRAKKTAILKRVDDELALIDKGLSDLSMHVKSERERISTELASLRFDAFVQNEVEQVRKYVESRFQNGVEQRTRELIADMMQHSGEPRELATDIGPQVSSLEPANDPIVNEAPLEGEEANIEELQQAQMQIQENNDQEKPEEEAPLSTKPSPHIQTGNTDTTIAVDNDSFSPSSPSSSPSSSTSSPGSDRKKRSRPSKAKRQRLARQAQAERQHESPSLIPSPLRVSNGN